MVNNRIKISPRIEARTPRWIESAPRAGPTVRSSSIATGTASEPARSTTARSAASWAVKRPVISPRVEMRERMAGAL